MTDRQAWFVAVLIVSIRVDGPDDEPLTDRQIRLIRATDAESAYNKALVLGAQENRSYLNAEGQTVRWEFLGLGDLDALQAEVPADQVEIWSDRLNGDGKDLVRPKSALTAFWLDANKDRTVEDVLGDSQ
jgi:uncharacterized protein DUF4288